MITLKQWKQFNEYREQKQFEFEASPELKALEDNLNRPRKWWESRSVIELTSFIEDKFDLQQKMVPPKTLEACLDWLQLRHKGDKDE